jgi:hypothetical protein
MQSLSLQTRDNQIATFKNAANETNLNISQSPANEAKIENKSNSNPQAKDSLQLSSDAKNLISFSKELDSKADSQVTNNNNAEALESKREEAVESKQAENSENNNKTQSDLAFAKIQENSKIQENQNQMKVDAKV